LSFKVKSPSIHFIFKKTHLEHKFLSVREKCLPIENLYENFSWFCYIYRKRNRKRWFGLMVFITTFNNTKCISVISWRSVLLVKETGGPRENCRHFASHWKTFITYCCTPRPDRDSN